MKHFPIHQYVHNFENFGLINPTEFVYRFIGDDMEKKGDILQFFRFLVWYFVLK